MVATLYNCIFVAKAKQLKAQIIGFAATKLNNDIAQISFLIKLSMNCRKKYS